MDEVISLSKAITAEAYFTGLRYSPDSTCILTSHVSDNTLHCYEPNPKSNQTFLPPALTSKCSTPIYSYSWYPFMNSSDPPTCAYLCSSRDNPLHLVDAYNGSLRVSYIAHDDKVRLDPRAGAKRHEYTANISSKKDL